MQTPAHQSAEKLLAEICASHATKSAQIRALAELGWPTARIAEALSIRYQHARNVLLAAGYNLKPAGINRPDTHKIAMAEYAIARLVAAGSTLPDIPKIAIDAENTIGRLMAVGINMSDIAKIAEDAEYAITRLTAAGINPADISDIAKEAESSLGRLVDAGINLSDISQIATAAESTVAYLTATKKCDYRYLQEALARAPQAGKKPVNLSINASLLAAAKLMNTNLSETLERELVNILSQQARDRWQAENREAIEAHNQFVERHGLWSDGLRQF